MDITEDGEYAKSIILAFVRTLLIGKIFFPR